MLIIGRKHIKLLALVFVVTGLFWFMQTSKALAFPLNPDPNANGTATDDIPNVLKSDLENCNGEDYSISPAFWQWLSPELNGAAASTTVPYGSTGPVRLTLHWASAVCSSPNYVPESRLRTDFADVTAGGGTIAGAQNMEIWLSSGSNQGDYRANSYTFDYYPPAAVTSPLPITIKFRNKSINRFTNGSYICIASPSPSAQGGWNYGFCPFEEPEFNLTIYPGPQPNQLPSGTISASCSATGVLTVGVNASDPNGGSVGVNLSIPTVGAASQNGSGSFTFGPYSGRPQDGVTKYVTGTVTDAQTGQAVTLQPSGGAPFNCAIPPPSVSCYVTGGNRTIEQGETYKPYVYVEHTGPPGSPRIQPIAVSFAVDSTVLPPASNPAFYLNQGSNYTFYSPGEYTSSSLGRFQVTARVTGTAGSFTIDQACTPVYLYVMIKPYFKVYGGDVRAGATFPGGPGCNTSAGIAGFATGSGTSYRGASGEFGVTALLNINTFYSTSQRTVANTQPKGLTFSNTGNTQANSVYGGGFGGGCAPQIDYFNGTRDPTVTQSAWGGSVPAPANSAISNKRRYIASALNLGAQNIPLGTQNALYVDGDVFITGNIQYASNGTNVNNIPYFALIVRGSIYIAPGVTRLDGLYIAQPSNGTNGKIYTCSPSRGGYYTAVALYSSCSGSQLVVNGALYAQQIKFLRTIGTLRNSTTQQLPGNWANASVGNVGEVISYIPELFLAPSPLRDPLNPAASNAYDAIFSLPPVF